MNTAEAPTRKAGRQMSRGLKLAGCSALAAIALSATGCSTKAAPTYFDLTDAQAAHAYAATEYAVSVIRYCGVPGDITPAPARPTAADAFHAGYCWAVTDEPTLALQRYADTGYTARITYAVAHGVTL